MHISKCNILAAKKAVYVQLKAGTAIFDVGACFKKCVVCRRVFLYECGVPLVPVSKLIVKGPITTTGL